MMSIEAFSLVDFSGKGYFEMQSPVMASLMEAVNNLHFAKQNLLSGTTQACKEVRGAAGPRQWKGGTDGKDLRKVFKGRNGS